VLLAFVNLTYKRQSTPNEVPFLILQSRPTQYAIYHGQ